MKKNQRRYAIRGVSDRVDRAMRRRARESGTRFNQFVFEALSRATGESMSPKRDFNEVIGSLSEDEASEMDDEFRALRQADKKLWE